MDQISHKNLHDFALNVSHLRELKILQFSFFSNVILAEEKRLKTGGFTDLKMKKLIAIKTSRFNLNNIFFRF